MKLFVLKFVFLVPLHVPICVHERLYWVEFQWARRSFALRNLRKLKVLLPFLFLSLIVLQMLFTRKVVKLVVNHYSGGKHLMILCLLLRRSHGWLISTNLATVFSGVPWISLLVLFNNLGIDLLPVITSWGAVCWTRILVSPFCCILQFDFLS